MIYLLFFTKDGVPQTGLTPVITIYKKVSDNSDVNSPPAITEIGGGGYKFSASPSESLFVVVDGGATLLASERYKVLQATPNDGALDAAVSTRALEDGGNISLVLNRVQNMTIATRVNSTLPIEAIRATSGDKWVKIDVFLTDDNGVAFDPADHNATEQTPRLYNGFGVEVSNEAGEMWTCYQDNQGTPLVAIAECHHTSAPIHPQVLMRTSTGNYYFWMNLADSVPLGSIHFLFAWFDRGRWDPDYTIADHRQEMQQIMVVDTTGLGSIQTLTTKVLQILSNRLVVDPTTGTYVIYADDGVTPVLTGTISGTGRSVPLWP